MPKLIKLSLLWTCLLTLLIVPTGCKTGCSRINNTGSAILVGIVTDVDLQVPVGKVSIQIENSATNRIYKSTTDNQGRYKITFEPGYYTLKAKKNGYTSYEKSIIISKGSQQEDFYISKLKEKPCTLEGTVVDEATGKPIGNVTIQVGMNIIRTDAKGYYKLESLLEGEYGIWVTVPGYDALNKTITLTRGINVAKFSLKKMTGDTPVREPEKKRNQEFAVDPTFLDDYICDSVRTVQPNKGTRTYHIISQDRYNKHVKFDEGQNHGEMIQNNAGVFVNLGNGWKEINELDIPSEADDVIKFDMVTILSGFNFQDDDLTITYKGTETMNGYQTKKYTMVSKPSAPAQKKCNLEIWMIDKHERLDINHAITRVRGRTMPEAPDFQIWADVDINFKKIGAGNKIMVPTLPK